MSVLLAQAFSLYFIVMGLALFLNSRIWPSIYKEFFQNRGLLVLAGVFALVLGILLILTHNIWVMGWPVLITVLSWWAFIKGALILLIPDRMIAFSSGFTEAAALKTAGLCMTLLGLLLGYFGFWAALL